MKHRYYSNPAIDRRAIRRGDVKDHDEKVWAAERARLAAEAEAKAQVQPSLDEVTGAGKGEGDA